MSSSPTFAARAFVASVLFMGSMRARFAFHGRTADEGFFDCAALPLSVGER